jgi:hypothetical protein
VHPYDHQNVWQNITQMGGIIDFMVGDGRSYDYNEKITGLIKKNLVTMGKKKMLLQRRILPAEKLSKEDFLLVQQRRL